MVYKTRSKHTAVTHGLEYYASGVVLHSCRHHIPSCLWSSYQNLHFLRISFGMLDHDKFISFCTKRKRKQLTMLSLMCLVKCQVCNMNINLYIVQVKHSNINLDVLHITFGWITNEVCTTGTIQRPLRTGWTIHHMALLSSLFIWQQPHIACENASHKNIQKAVQIVLVQLSIRESLLTCRFHLSDLLQSLLQTAQVWCELHGEERLQPGEGWTEDFQAAEPKCACVRAAHWALSGEPYT